MLIIPFVIIQDFFEHAQMLHSDRIQATCRHIDFHAFRGQAYH